MVENCTVVTNRSLRPGTSATVSYGGGIYIGNAAAVVRNNIAAQLGEKFNPKRVSTSPQVAQIQSHLSRTGSVGDANLSVRSAFIDPDGGNFRLQPESPAVDSGLNVTWLADSTDLDGNLRLQRSKPGVSGKVLDRGAYELQPARGTILLLR